MCPRVFLLASCSSPDSEVSKNVFTERPIGNAIPVAQSAVDVIDTGSLERVKSIPTKGGIHNVYVTPDGKYVVAGSIAGRNFFEQ